MKTLANRISKLEGVIGPNIPEVHLTFSGSDHDEELNRLYRKEIINEENAMIIKVRFVRSNDSPHLKREGNENFSQ